MHILNSVILRPLWLSFIFYSLKWLIRMKAITLVVGNQVHSINVDKKSFKWNRGANNSLAFTCNGQQKTVDFQNLASLTANCFQVPRGKLKFLTAFFSIHWHSHMWLNLYSHSSVSEKKLLTKQNCYRIKRSKARLFKDKGWNPCSSWPSAGCKCQLHSSIIHNLQKVEIAQMPINWWINKIFSHKKQWSTDSCDNMDELWKHYAKGKKPDTKSQKG